MGVAPDWYYQCNNCGWDSIAYPDFLDDDCPDCGASHLERIELDDIAPITTD